MTYFYVISVIVAIIIFFYYRYKNRDKRLIRREKRLLRQYPPGSGTTTSLVSHSSNEADAYREFEEKKQNHRYARVISCGKHSHGKPERSYYHRLYYEYW